MSQEMNKESVKNIIEAIMSKLDELACTVCDSNMEKDELVTGAFVRRERLWDLRSAFESKAELIGTQYNALADTLHYTLNAATEHGMMLIREQNI